LFQLIQILNVILLLLSTSVKADLKSDTLFAHNKWRINLNAGLIDDQPRPSPPIALMEWDENLAAQAQDYADSCADEHAAYADRFGAGENLSWGLSAVQAVDSWAGEHKYYIYPQGFTSGTGHYTQVVWSDSTKLGCGWNPACKMTVCRYLSHGNFNDQAPYTINGADLSNLYSNDFIIKNIIYNNTYYKIELKNMVLHSIEQSSYDSAEAINYIFFFDHQLYLYIPKLSINGIEYYVFLAYQDNGIFTLPFFGKNQQK